MSEEYENDFEEGEEEEFVVTLTDEDGNDYDFSLIARFEFKDKEYAVLEPVDTVADMEDGDVLIYSIATSEDGDEEVLLPLESDEELGEVFAEFQRQFADYMTGCDCGDEHCTGGCDTCCGCHDDDEE